MNMVKPFKVILALFAGFLLMTITCAAYLSVYFTASQPENYGRTRFKVLAWGCIAAFFTELIATIWTAVRLGSARLSNDGEDQKRVGS